MKKLIFCLLIVSPCFLFAQLGVKSGVNFANVSDASSINSSNRSGFMIGAFFTPKSKRLIVYRTEVIYSRQGYDFKTSTKTGNVNLDYILMPQLMGINITKYIQLQLGAQMAFLINAKADSTTSTGSTGPYDQVMSYYNKFDYGYAIGAEIHPGKGLLIGARYNVSLGKLYSDIQSGQRPSFSAEDAKNNVVQVFAGWRF